MGVSRERAAVWPVQLLLAVLGLLTLLSAPAFAQDRAQLLVTSEDGYGRLVVEFPSRMSLPAYKLTTDNGVLAITFTDPVQMTMPDVAIVLPDYISIGRSDPDSRGIRFGLKTAITVHAMEAGERLYVDLMPPNWRGLPPSLPPEVVAELSQRAQNAAIVAEKKRKAAETAAANPQAKVTVARNPTFMRVQFDWNTDVDAKYVQDGITGTIAFSWPVGIDLYDLASDLPPEIQAVVNKTDEYDSNVVLTLAQNVAPRFYALSGRQYILDVDLSPEQIEANAQSAQEAALEARRLETEAALAAAAKQAALEADGLAIPDPMADDPQAVIDPIVPTVTDVGGTVRVTFPFDRDTASAVFRRGDTVWMLFDTPAPIFAPADPDALEAIANGFTVIPSAKTQIVRLDLAADRLATLASEGRSWVLSLGDILLGASEPLTLTRERDKNGRFQMTALLGRPGAVHSFNDPDVGDTLDIVTVFPPSRSASRDLAFVDFQALRSAHGLVVRPESDGLEVTVEGEMARISLDGGLTLSDQDGRRTLDSGDAAEFRDSYIDLAGVFEANPGKLTELEFNLSTEAAAAEGQARDLARLKLAQFYAGNQLGYEAIGVLKVLDADLKTDELKKKSRLTLAVAETISARPKDALAILNSPAYADEVDALMWRTIARTDAEDFVGAREDALVSQSAIGAYPLWVRQRFLLSAARAAIETTDLTLAHKMLDNVGFSYLTPEDATLYQVLQGRIAEAEGRVPEAMDTYGQVIAAEIRPTRAEAVFRTLSLLKESGQIDFAKATDTLSAEALMWRGNSLEADMQKLLAELYFEDGAYRDGFETVKSAVAYYPESPQINALLDEASVQFSDLYLNGKADKLSDIDALGIYYDFRQLTPPGARGDEMIRNLARRLVKVDLLAQAGDLLEYQISSRLKGVAQSQVATDLALIRLAERDPEAALRVLHATRLAELPPAIERQRRILEARALIDANREDLALDLLSRLTGRDADLLRVDAYWKMKNYSAASDLIEIMYGGDASLPLSGPARVNILKAAVGLVLGNDKLGLDRVRTKFAERMSQSAEWPLFDYVTSPNAEPAGLEFKQAAKQVSGIDTLTAFIGAYKQVYASDPDIQPDHAKPDPQV